MKNENTAPQVSEQDRKMTKGELISYGLGGVASTMPSQFKTSYVMNFIHLISIHKFKTNATIQKVNTDLSVKHIFRGNSKHLCHIFS